MTKLVSDVGSFLQLCGLNEVGLLPALELHALTLLVCRRSRPESCESRSEMLSFHFQAPSLPHSRVCSTAQIQHILNTFVSVFKAVVNKVGLTSVCRLPGLLCIP
jgi:hypothetical protein